jgi:hypothetical protein
MLPGQAQQLIRSGTLRAMPREENSGELGISAARISVTDTRLGRPETTSQHNWDGSPTASTGEPTSDI